MDGLIRLSDKDLRTIFDAAFMQEKSGVKAAVSLENIHAASIVAELMVARSLIDDWGVNDTLDAHFEASKITGEFET